MACTRCLGLLTLLAAAAAGGLGCNSVSGVGDFQFDLPPVDQPIPCIDPVPAMVITEDTTLCAGTFAMPVSSGAAAIDVVAGGVTLRCLGTMLDGQGSVGLDPDDPTVGIRVGAYEDVTIKGCGAHGYRYGLFAKGASTLTLSDGHFDDNFTDLSAEWVYEVYGGGVRLEQVSGAVVDGCSFARNWNGIELISSSAVQVSNNTADHCSNTAALLLDTHDSTVQDNAMSWAIRPALSYPDNWYGVTTYDSAGILIEQGSTNNTISGNDTTYGGNGIFARGLSGCPTGNVIKDNDVSFSPHNGIECWCDDHRIEGNTADACHFGIWTGGADNALIVDNVVSNSIVDGISIQIGEDRHTIIQDNEVSSSGRVGILLSGREYQAGHTLSHWSGAVANSSHIVVQRNELFLNTEADLFATSTRLLVLASNCSPTHNDAYVFGKEVEVARIVGGCGTGGGRIPPQASLADPGQVLLGDKVSFDASGSQPATPGAPLSFSWLVQPAGSKFLSGNMPPLVAGGVELGAKLEVSFEEAGLFDVDVTADDGRLAAMAHRQVAVIPTGKRIGETAASWDFVCDDGCVTTFTDEPNGIDGEQVHMKTDSAFAWRALAPKSKDLGYSAKSYVCPRRSQPAALVPC